MSRSSSPADLDAREAPVNEQDALDTVMQELGSTGATVRVYKWDETNPSKTGYAVCGRFPADAFDPYTLADTYGPGRFRLQFVKDGRAVRAVDRTFLAPVKSNGSAPAPSLGGVDLVQLLMEDRRRASDFQTQMTLALVQAIGGGRAIAPPVAGTSVSDLLAIMREARESATPPAPVASPNVAALRELMELAGTLKGSSGDEDGEGSGLLGSLAPRVLGLLEKLVTQPAAPPRPPRMAAPKQGEPAPVAAGGNPVPADPMVALVRKYAPAVIAEAKAGRDAFAWGSFVGERCPEEWWEPLLRLASADEQERLEFLGTYAPEALPYAAWLAEACKGIVSLSEDEDDADGAPVGADDGADGAGGTP